MSHDYSSVVQQPFPFRQVLPTKTTENFRATTPRRNTGSTAMDQRGLLTQLGQLQERVDLLQVNLQKVSSRTLSNSRTCNLEDRVTDLEEGPPPSEPTLTTDIFEDIARQMGIFDQQFQNLETKTKTKDFLDTMDQKVDKCNKKVDTYQNDYFEWVEQWKVDNSHIIQDFRKALVNQQKQIDQILHALQQQGVSTAEPSNPTKPNLVHFPKWRPRSPPTKRPRGCSSPRLHQSGAADE